MKYQFNEEVMGKMVELVNNGSTRGKIEAFGKWMYDQSTNEAKAYTAEAFERCGISTNAYGRADHEETVKYLIANYGKLEKKELISGMCEINGKTYKTNQHAYNYIPMMIEWSKQELANS